MREKQKGNRGGGMSVVVIEKVGFLLCFSPSFVGDWLREFFV